MPPSTATYVRTPGMSLIVPTVYTRDGGGGDDRPARLDADVGVARRAPRHASSTTVGPLGDRRRLLALDVGDAEAAAEHELGQVERRGELGHHLGRPGEALGGEHVRADVAVQADEFDRRRPPGPLDGARRRRRWPRLKPNLESSWPVAMYSWVWACTPGVMRSSTSGTPAARGVQRVEAVELVEAVDDDVAHAGVDRRAQLVDALVVAVERARRSAGTPAASATCSSPPLATSSSMPSSWARRAIARHRNALVA